MGSPSLEPRGALRAGLLLLVAATTAVPGGSAELPPQRPSASSTECPTPYVDEGEIAWVEAKLDAALGRAHDRNVPLVVFACLADEEHNEEFRRNLGGNATLAAALRNALPMYASNGEPPPGANLVKHRELMDEVYNRFVAESHPDGQWPLPEILVVAPSGEVLARLGSGHTVADSEVVKAVREANGKLGGGVAAEVVPVLKELRDKGRKHQAAKSWVDAWRAWRGILEITGAGPFAAEAKKALPETEAALTKELEAVAEGLDETNVAERYALVRDVVRHGRGTPIERVASKLVTVIERDKRFKALVPALRIAEEAEDLLHDALVLLSSGDEAGANKVFKKLGGKRFVDTEAARRARASHAERMQ